MGPRAALCLGRAWRCLAPPDTDRRPPPGHDSGGVSIAPGNSGLPETAEYGRSQCHRQLFLPVTKAGALMKRPRIFISHAWTDREWVRSFAESLKAQGVQVWLDEMQVPAGKRLEQAIEQGFRDSDVVAFVITAD